MGPIAATRTGEGADGPSPAAPAKPEPTYPSVRETAGLIRLAVCTASALAPFPAVPDLSEAYDLLFEAGLLSSMTRRRWDQVEERAALGRQVHAALEAAGAHLPRASVVVAAVQSLDLFSEIEAILGPLDTALDIADIGGGGGGGGGSGARPGRRSFRNSRDSGGSFLRASGSPLSHARMMASYVWARE